jgi:hypothetical protein
MLSETKTGQSWRRAAVVIAAGLLMAMEPSLSQAALIGVAAPAVKSHESLVELARMRGGAGRGHAGGAHAGRAHVGGVHGGAHGRGYVHGGGVHGGVRHGGGPYHGRWGAWARPGRYWWRPGGAIAAGAAIGFVTAATAAAWAGAAPGPGLCWYYTDPSRTQGFWDACP